MAAMIKQRIGFIGARQMATALGEGFCRAGLVPGAELIASDPSTEARQHFASATGGQAVHAGRDTVMTGRDSAVTSADTGEQPAEEDWWASLRKRGVVTTISIIVTAIASVAAIIVTVLVAAGWKP